MAGQRRFDVNEFVVVTDEANPGWYGNIAQVKEFRRDSEGMYYILQNTYGTQMKAKSTEMRALTIADLEAFNTYVPGPVK